MAARQAGLRYKGVVYVNTSSSFYRNNLAYMRGEGVRALLAARSGRLFQQEGWMSFRLSIRSLILFGAFVCGVSILQLQDASAACVSQYSTVKGGQSYHGATCSVFGSQSFCSCTVQACVLGRPGHVITSYYLPSCQALNEQLTVRAVPNQTGYDLYYSGAYFLPGKQVQITLSGGFRMVPENVGTQTVKSGGSFTGYRLLTCPAGTQAPQNMFLNADAASTPVSFSCAVQE